METSDPTRERASESRARAARTKRDRTRAALLGAADPAFAARGWARTRVEDIASAAGVSNATAYNHFPSKHALIGHVYAPLVQTLRTQAYRDIAAGRPVIAFDSGGATRSSSAQREVSEPSNANGVGRARAAVPNSATIEMRVPPDRSRPAHRRMPATMAPDM